MSSAKRAASEGIPQEPSEGDITKKARMAAKPSRVIHIRNLPDSATAADLLPHLMKYATPSNVIMMTNKQALVEMPSVEVASRVIDSEPTIRIRDSQAYLQFSEHQELERVQTRDTNPPSKCLIAKVTNLSYSISLQTLHSLFSRAGRVDKMVCFMKQSFLQALVQMDSEASAALARRMLNNQDIYSGCCHLAVEFSKLNEVTVRQDSDPARARDFIRSPLMDGETLPNTPINLQPQQQQMMGNTGAMNVMATMQGMSPAMGPMGGAMGGQMPQAQAPGMPTMGMGSAMGMQMAPGMPATTPGCVVLVSNLNEATIQPDHLFMLCGVYGDVTRVKIMHKNRSRALVQFMLPQHAATAISNLNGLPFQGNQLRLVLSKFPEVALPRNDEEAQLTKDYSKSKIHRFKSQESYKHIHPPCPVLHLSRLPAEANDVYVTQLFVTHGFQPKRVHMFPEDKKMAFVELNSVQEAAEALVALHNKMLGDNLYLRVAFSRHAHLS
ncbi:polypyrimidine tract-binding protein 1 isoform d [Salpingoeca rosetta]|uniref:Polypyrimidine tract-binding protein 1 isoform d n=1 Tax=Salpingoeca rosetta (strain ATCC 50818 / BSB-021) TaxID=946362 RepID=F2TX08_SALR5|nr:polypyrimidine tract-binding protein 1 isoform d [Salpingoeca rosetta]EGD75917.1 polypyrimidine tract-binding protein 1 isoform d [Salpingoeca rosetta]|eukprot:XP_004998093.1 polypyrimidine tract-binding protein 1 isoform d [Salpingoeca rosetta]